MDAYHGGLKEGEMSSGVFVNTIQNDNNKQTTIMAVTFEGGVVLGADSRTSTGLFIVNTDLVSLG